MLLAKHLTDPFTRQYNQQQQLGPDGQPAAEGERGLGGALAGGAAGAFGGHQAGHGFLGAIGGAIIGSLAEDKFKDHKHHKQDEQQYGGRNQHSTSFTETLGFNKRN